MEPIESLNQKQRKRRLKAFQECHNVLKDCLDKIKENKDALQCECDNKPLGETPDKHLSSDQLEN